jgi:hypothetical protein
LIRAIVRAHRWRRKIESGRQSSAVLSSLGGSARVLERRRARELIDAYVCRLLPLTCLAPDIVEAILDGRQPRGLRLAEALGNGPLAWEERRVNWGFGGCTARIGSFSAQDTA